MALPRKGSRRIVVDGIAYRWYIRSKPTYSQSMGWSDLTVAVQQDDAPKTTTLVIEMPFTRPDAVGASDPAPVVTPADVSRCIKEAIKKGWTPEQAGSTFLFQA